MNAIADESAAMLEIPYRGKFSDTTIGNPISISAMHIDAMRLNI